MNETEKYEEQLRKIQQASFKVPDGYFEELPRKVMDKIDLLEGKTTASSTPFVTPEGYFDNLSASISARITAKPAFITLFKRRIVLIPVACAILVTGFIFFTQNNKTEQAEYASEDLENSTYFQSIDEDMLLDELVLISNNTDTNDSLTQYIIDNNIELSDLEKEL